MKSGAQEPPSEKRETKSRAGKTPLEDTLQRYARFLDDGPGIFASLREYELPWESPIHLCVAELKPEFCKAPKGTRQAISATVCGAGTSVLQAKVRCLGEALERRSGIFRDDEPQRVARYCEIAEEAVHPDVLTLFSESQYKDRQRWNQHEGAYNWVPGRFDAARQVAWSPAWSLTQQRVTYLPTAYCYFGYPFDPTHDFCRPDSNGNAAGNNLDEAIVHGFLELVERECASVWWYNRIRRPRVDLASFSLPHVGEVCKLHRMLGRSFDVLDITLDRSIPCFVAVSRPEEPPRDDYAFGFGAHFDAQIAITKAVTELTQFLPVVLADRDPGCFLRAADVPTDMSFLMPEERVPATSRSDFSPTPAGPLRHDALFCAELAKSWGLEMLVLDQTRKDLDMPVVKVVAPGMRGWWARFAPGRLYTLPVQAGWFARQKTELELNPDHLIL